MRVVALLRGVNIGNVRIPMDQLATALTEYGFADVRTVLASGNVLLTADGDDLAPVAAEVRAVILDRFGFEITVIALPLDIVRTAADAYPFPRAADRHAYVVFGERTDALAGLLDAAGTLDPAVERVAAGAGVLYWDAPKGETLTTAFGRRSGARLKSGAVTTRNLNTLEKILAAG